MHPVSVVQEAQASFPGGVFVSFFEVWVCGDHAFRVIPPSVAVSAVGSTCGFYSCVCVVTTTVALRQVLALEASWLHIFLESPDGWRWREVGKGRSWDESEFWPEPDGEASTRQARKEAEFQRGCLPSFLCPLSSFVLCTLRSSSTLVSDLWNLLACLSVINDHANACQVFPFEKLGITGWVREETARNRISKLLPQKRYLMKQDSQNTGYYDVKEGHSASKYSSLWYWKKHRVLSEITQSQYLAGDLIRNQEPFFARAGNAVAEIIKK